MFQPELQVILAFVSISPLVTFTIGDECTEPAHDRRRKNFGRNIGYSPKEVG